MGRPGHLPPSAPPPHRPPAVLHHDPPLTPAGVLLHRWWLVPLLAAAFTGLAVTAGVDDGRFLAGLDEPVARTLIDWRSGPLDGIVKTVSALGGVTVAASMLVVLGLLVRHECRPLAWTLVAASATRPLLEWALKELVDRPRPDIDRLVAGNGPSFPRGTSWPPGTAPGRWAAHGLLGTALAGRALVGHLTLPLLVVLEGPGFLPLLVARPSEDPGRRRRPDQ